MQKSSTNQAFDWILNTAIGNTVKKVAIWKAFPQFSLKRFVSFILIMQSLFCRKCQKNVLQKEKTEPWKPIYYWGNQFLIPADWIIENNLCQILCVVLEFLSNGEGLEWFLQQNLPKLGKITVTCPKSVKGNK